MTARMLLLVLAAVWGPTLGLSAAIGLIIMAVRLGQAAREGRTA